MKIGVFATFMSPLATPQMIRDFGRRAEDIGLDSIWMGEHVALFDKNTFGYPGSKDGRIPVPPGGGMLDVAATFGFLAAATSRLRFGTGVALVPQRNPIYTAKEMCTLDWLTDGRIDFGIGVGWNKEEVEACGYRWEDRGARCDEFLEVMQRLWTEPVVDFAGKWVKFETCRLDPSRSRNHTCRSSSAAMPMRPCVAPCVSAPAGMASIAIQPPPRRCSTELDAAFAKAGRKRGKEFQIIITPPALDADGRDAGIRRGRGRSPGGEPGKPAARTGRPAHGGESTSW